MPSLGRILRAAAVLAIVAAPGAARALDWNVRVEPGAAYPLTDPQATRYGLGGAGALKGGLGLTKWLDVGVSVHYLGFFASMGEGSSTLAAGGGARLKWRSLLVVSPWVDFDVLYVRTGPLDRVAAAGAAGVSFGLGARRMLWLGPFVRYLHVFAPDEPGTDSADAKLLLFGVSVEVGSPQSGGELAPDGDGDGIPDQLDACPREGEDRDGFEDADGCPDRDNDKDGVLDEADKCPTLPGRGESAGCPDEDADGVADAADKCPGLGGAVDAQGCPVYKGVTLTADKIELAEKLFFAYDAPDLLPKSEDILGEVARLLKDHPELRVRVEGHTDDRGIPKHNLELSQGRADAVRKSLIAHGVPAERVEAKGYGSERPIDTNKTNEGRDRNRRVDLVIIK